MRDLVNGQLKINENLFKKFAANDKILEGIKTNVDTLSTALQNQQSFNKNLESKLAQLAAALPSSDTGKIPGHPSSSPCANVSVVSVRWGNPSRTSFATNHAGRTKHQRTNSWEEPKAKFEEQGYPAISCHIWNHHYGRALCDLGASINIMPKVIFDELNYPTLSPTMIRL